VIDGGVYPNNAWAAASSSSTRVVDASCGAGNTLSVRLAPNASIAQGTFAALRFQAPPQTTIADFTLAVRHRWSAGDASSLTYNLLHFGTAYAISLVGHYDPNWVNKPGQLYWGNSGAIDKSLVLSRRDSPIAMAQPAPTYLDLRAGCWAGEENPCATAGSVAGRLDMSGARITIADNQAPQVGVVGGQGLLAAGVRSGAEPVTFNASDNTGIRSAELVDVTDAAQPSTIATTNVACDYTRARPCPDVSGGSVAAPRLIAGQRTLLVRVTDAAGNQSVSAPFTVTARGGLNGANGGYGAKLSAGFPRKVHRGKGRKRRLVTVLRRSRTVSYGKGAGMRGTLRAADGRPIVGAQLRLLVRDDRLGARYADRGAIITGADGRFAFHVPHGSSRVVRVAYRAFEGDASFAATGTSTLNVRARISATGPRRVRPHGVATFRGRLVGRPFPPRGVTLDLQIFQPRVGWRVFGTTRTRENGRFRISYHFQPASRGRFTFRLRLRPSDAYPYTRGSSRRLRVRVG
jgi:hypothetical protein